MSMALLLILTLLSINSMTTALLQLKMAQNFRSTLEASAITTQLPCSSSVLLYSTTIKCKAKK